MEKLISLKERIKKISYVVDSVENTGISLIEKDILLKDIRELYEDIAAFNVKTSVTEEKQQVYNISETEKEITEDNAIIEAFNKINESEEVKEEMMLRETSFDDYSPEQETNTGKNTETGPKEEVVITPKKDEFSIEFLDDPFEENPETINENIKENITPEKPTIHNHEKQKSDHKRQEAEQTSLFSGNSFGQETKTIGEQLVNNRTYLNEVLAQNKQQADVSSIMGQKPVSDIKSAIGIGDRFLFIRELFDGKSELFEETIRHLNLLSSFEEAKNYLNQFEWNQTQDTVISFNNIVKRRYL
ncbi:MAG: hypothetical protein LBQ22_04915 [Bacteroidales bacterium]|jgi:hypothetical protein|nr:hypothetical protein [Bacteroidales bacterium]